MVADEMTYGLDLETAMDNLGSRVCQQDPFPHCHSDPYPDKHGWNLAEILACCRKSCEKALKLRMKVKVIGRGQMVCDHPEYLAVRPVRCLALVAPGFYGDVWDEPIVHVLLAASVWLIIGT